MASFDVTVVASVHRDLRRLDAGVVVRLLTAIEALADDPLPDGVRKLAGAEGSYRLRVGDYRILFDLDFGNRHVTVYRARHRREACR